jgi:alkylation response protein AidB-like acyl-CoA dehydrogenase
VDPRLPVEAETYRQEVREFLARHLREGWRGLGSIADRDEADAFVETWRETLYANGMLGVAWPKEYGGQGLTKVAQVVLAEEFARSGVPTMGYNDTFGIKMVGNTLLRWGTEEQRQRFLPRILSGEDRWCQGYSEPDAGSDLAGLSTRARPDGDRWVIDGQKIWTSRAREANWIFVLTRTDPQASKHRGITFLLVPMDQPGISVRPIRALSGESEFNEVFFDGATTDAANVVGDIDGGWAVAQTLLGLERGEEAATNPILFRAELDRLAAMASEVGMNPVERDALVQLHVRCEIMRFLGYRILTQVLNGDGTLGPESSIAKLYWSEYHKAVADVAVKLLGARAMVLEGRVPLRAYRTDDPGAPNTTGSWLGTLWNATAGTIYAGTSQVQRNIIGEVILGLPKEPRA